MHIEKNVCDAILGTLMNISVKRKDVKAMRDYFECKGIRPELWPQVKVSKKRNRVDEVGGSNKGKGNKNKIMKKLFASSLLHIVQGREAGIL